MSTMTPASTAPLLIDFTQYYSVREAAALLGFSTQYVHELRQTGKLRSIALPGGRFLCARADVQALLAARQAKQARRNAN